MLVELVSTPGTREEAALVLPRLDIDKVRAPKLRLREDHGGQTISVWGRAAPTQERSFGQEAVTTQPIEYVQADQRRAAEVGVGETEAPQSVADGPLEGRDLGWRSCASEANRRS